jgi:hypothetical protein
MFQNTDTSKFITPKRRCMFFFVTCGPASHGFQFTYSSMTLVTLIKKKIGSAVGFSYGLNPGRPPYSIAPHAQALLKNNTFIYQVRLIASPFSAKLRTVSVNRTRTLGGVHDIHIDTPFSNESSTSYGSKAAMTTGLSLMNTSHPSHLKSLPFHSRW